MAISAAKLMVEVGADTREAEAGLKGFTGKLNNAAKSLAKTGGALSLGITTPLLGIATAGVNLAADFEQSMNILQQVVGATESDMASLQEQALQLGADTVFSAGEAAEGMLELGKAGMDSAQIMAAIPGVMDLAAAAGTSLGQAAGITAAALNAFGLEASESTRVADMLAAGANASAADITDLAQGLQQAGFAFDMANQPIENLVASLALLTNVGLTGSDAGTALKNAFMRMMNPTNEALELMKQLNISFYDAQGNMMQLPAIIDMLNASLAGLTPQQRDAALSTIFMSDGMKAMIPLLDAGSAGFNAMVAEVSQVGAATETANARMGGLKGGLEQLNGALESFMIGAALPFLDMLGGLARGAADAVTGFGELPQPIINASLAFAGVLAAAGPLMLALSGLAAAFAFLLTPVGAVVVGVAALAAAWAADVGGLQAITAQVAGQVQQGFSQMLAGAQQLASGIQAAFSNTAFPSLDELVNQFRTGGLPALIAEINTTAVELMVNLNTQLNISGQAEQLRTSIMEGLRGAMAGLGNIDWGQLAISTAGLVDQVSTAINNINWTSVGASLGTALVEAAKMSVGAAGWAATFLYGLGQDLAVALSSWQWAELDAAFVGLSVAIREAIYNMASGMASTLGPAFASVNASFATYMQTLGESIRTAIVPQISMDWGKMGEPIDWATIIPPLDWGVLADPIAWGNFVTAINWGDWIGALQWTGYVATLGWADFVMGLDWVSFVPSISWSSFVPSMNWGSYVTSITWDSFIPDFNWSSFVPTIDWGRFIPFLNLGGGGGGSAAPSSGGGGGGGGGGFGGGGGVRSTVGVNGITVNVASVNSPMDVHSMASTLAREIRRRVR